MHPWRFVIHRMSALASVCAEYRKLIPDRAEGKSVHAGDTRPRTDLLLWAASAGIQCSTLRSDDTLHVRGLAAQTNITGETVIVSLPRRVALSVSAGQKCPAPHLIPEEAWSNAEK